MGVEMQNNQDNLPRNLIFMISLIISAVAAYFLNSSLYSFLDTLFDISVSSNFAISLSNSSLWGIASYWSTFALLIFTLLFILPAISNFLSLISLKSSISGLPRASDNAPSVTKDKFLKAMSPYNLVYSEFAVPYSAYIVERQEKEISKKSKFLGKSKTKKDHLVLVSVLIPASQIFKLERVLSFRLSTWFMRPLPRVLMGIGFLLLLLSISGSLQSDEGGLIGNEIFLMGVSSLSLCIGVGVFIAALFRIIMGHIFHRAGEVVKMIENLFEYKPGDSELGDFNSVEKALNKSISSIKDMLKILSEGQANSDNSMIEKTLDVYVKKISSQMEEQTKAVQKIIEDTAIQATKISKASNATIKNNKILENLDKTSAEIDILSQAADNVVVKFDMVTGALERVIEQIEMMAPLNLEKKSHLSADIEELKKVSSKTVGMGRRSPKKSKK